MSVCKMRSTKGVIAYSTPHTVCVPMQTRNETNEDGTLRSKYMSKQGLRSHTDNM